MTSRIVFISYSHDSDEHRDKVLALSERLRADGLETCLDQYVNGTPTQGWPRWMLDQRPVEVVLGDAEMAQSPVSPWDKGARLALAAARRLIEKHGYGRRLEELGDAEEASEHW